MKSQHPIVAAIGMIAVAAFAGDALPALNPDDCGIEAQAEAMVAYQLEAHKTREECHDKIAKVAVSGEKRYIELWTFFVPGK